MKALLLASKPWFYYPSPACSPLGVSLLYVSTTKVVTNLSLLPVNGGVIPSRITIFDIKLILFVLFAGKYIQKAFTKKGLSKNGLTLGLQ